MSGRSKKNNNEKREGKWGIYGGIETYLVGEKDESFLKTVSQLLSISKDGGAAVALPWILCDNGSNGMKALRNRRERMGLEKDEE